MNSVFWACTFKTMAAGPLDKGLTFQGVLKMTAGGSGQGQRSVRDGVHESKDQAAQMEKAEGIWKRWGQSARSRAG